MGHLRLSAVLANRGRSGSYINLHRQVYGAAPARPGQPYPLDYFSRPGYATSFHLVVPFVATAEKPSSISFTVIA